MAKSLRSIKAWQWLRHFGRLFVERTFAPFKDQSALLQLLSYPIFLLLVFLAGGIKQAGEEAFISWASFQALIYATPFYILVNIVTSALSVGDEIRKKGTWVDKRFVYHEPLHVYTTEIGPADNGSYHMFKVDDVEPNSFVNYKIDYHGGLGVALIGRSSISTATRKTNYGSRINAKRMEALSFQIPGNSDRTIVRVSIVSWEI